jgi:hypothetical protein
MTTNTPEQITMQVLDYRTAQLAALGPVFSEEVDTLRRAAVILENYVDVKEATA